MSSWLAPTVVMVLGLAMMVRERLAPARDLRGSPSFTRRASLLSATQAATVWLLAGRIDGAFASIRPWPELEFGAVGGAALGYLVITFANYWWHRARHESPLLWRWLHQLHHNPGRIEVLTSFYKHPLEILANVGLASLVLTGLLGLSPAASAAATLASGLAELIYHWNVRTPRWLGLFFQRPEMHCVHHQRHRHAMNYGDLPLWDMLFGTYENPRRFEGECGFSLSKEERVASMLSGIDLFAPCPQPRAGRWRVALVLALGLAQMFCDLTGLSLLGGVAMATAASPAPRVFTSLPDGQGGLVDPFADDFSIEVETPEGTTTTRALTPETYGALRGPYNRRNTYGALVAGAAYLEGHELTESMWRAALEYTACGRSEALDELGLPPRAPGSRVTLLQRERASGSLRQWSFSCR